MGLSAAYNLRLHGHQVTIFEKKTKLGVLLRYGIPEEAIIKAARIYAGAEAGSIVYAMGITQHVHGTDGLKALANLVMLCGSGGIPRGGLNPLRGQNNG